MKGMKGLSRRRALSKTPVSEAKVSAVVGFGRRAFAEVETQFDEFEVPVAELAPEELIDGVGGFVEAIVGESVVDGSGDGAEAVEDPSGFERRVGGEFGDGAVVAHRHLVAGLFGAIDVHEEEAGGVPDLVGEGAVAFGAGFAEGDVGAGGGHRCEGEADGVGAVALDDIDGVDDVALGLRHLLAVGVADQGVDVDLTEGHGVLRESRLLPSGIGTSSVKWQPSMIMRATQKKRMSKPVTRSEVG